MATSDASETRVRVAAFEELSTDLLYQILRLRVDVFVVEQRCPYPDLDGRDTDPTTRHVWAERDGAVLGYLRIVVEPDGTVHEITPGVIYVLPDHEPHDLRGGTEDMHLISVFNPAITGDEKHTLSEDGYSSY